MYVACFPEEFTGVELNAHRTRPRLWDVLGETYATNPALLVGPVEDAMVRLWAEYDQHGTLPDAAGGSLDQPSVMREAFATMTSAKHEALEERRRLARAGRRGH